MNPKTYVHVLKKGHMLEKSVDASLKYIVYLSAKVYKKNLYTNSCILKGMFIILQKCHRLVLFVFLKKVCSFFLRENIQRKNKKMKLTGAPC